MPVSNFLIVCLSVFVNLSNAKRLVLTFDGPYTLDDILLIPSGQVSPYGNTSGSQITAGVASVNADAMTEHLFRIDRRILSVETDYEYIALKPTRRPESTNTLYSWGIDRSDGKLDDKVSRSSSDGTGVSIYVIDTGVFAGHNEFQVDGRSRVQAGMDFTVSPPGRGDSDCHGHGTHVSSTAAGKNLGYATNALIYPVKVLSCSGSGSLTNVILGIEWASKQPGRKVISMSIGGGRSDALNKATKNAVALNAVVVVAAGNSAADACGYSPASELSAITVAATTKTDERAYYSNYGACIDMYAPGSDIIGASPISRVAITSMSGTSMACPHVSGVSATILQEMPSATPDQVRLRLLAWAEVNKITHSMPGTPNFFLRNQSPSVPTKMPTLMPTKKPSNAVATLRPTHSVTVRPTISSCVNKSETQCILTNTCRWFPFWNCQAVNFCGFRFESKCVLYSACKWNGNTCVTK